MTYAHPIEIATSYATRAFERMKASHLSPTPDTFELWYVYYSKSNAEVQKAIDLILSSGAAVTDERCHEIHERFLSDVAQSERVRHAGDAVQATIGNIHGIVSGVRENAAQYNAALTETQAALRAPLGPAQIGEVLERVRENTDGMIRHNRLLETELDKSFEIMRDLQRDLETVRKEALTDGLTHLSNRKAFDAEIARMAAAFEQGQSETFALALLDIDHFKSFNDTHGHQIGDQVLRLVAHTLTDGVKGRDMAARYGGEEFAILLPDTPCAAAFKVTDSLRKAVAIKEVVNRATGEKLGRITLSGGVAAFQKGESIESVIERADRALYNAKRAGRNQILIAEA